MQSVDERSEAFDIPIILEMCPMLPSKSTMKTGREMQPKCLSAD